MKKGITGSVGAINLRGIVLMLACSLALSFTSCDKDDNDNDIVNSIRPSGPKPAWGPTITFQMQTVIEKLQSYGAPPIYTLTPQQARLQPGIDKAAMDVMTDYKIANPAMNVDTSGVEIPVTGGQIHARVYTPKMVKSSYPVIVYYHGGGWVIATVDTCNASAQALSENTGAVVVSVEYRKGPENKFPTAHNDAYQSYAWVLKNLAVIKGDSTQIAVAGESAGGNLAANVSRMAKQNGLRLPVHQLLIYPVANNDLNATSVNQYMDAIPLGKPALPWFFMHYLNNMVEGDDPRMSLADVADLTGLPPTTIVAAEIDPLQTEGKLLADKLTLAGVSVNYRLYTGVTHEFFGLYNVIPEAKQAQNYAAEQIKKNFK